MLRVPNQPRNLVPAWTEGARKWLAVGKWLHIALGERNACNPDCPFPLPATSFLPVRRAWYLPYPWIAAIKHNKQNYSNTESRFFFLNINFHLFNCFSLFIIIQLFLSLRIIIRRIRFSPEWNFLTWFRMKENSIRKQKVATSTFLPLLPLLLFIISLIIQSIPQGLIYCCFLLPPNNTRKYRSRSIGHS